MNHLIAYDLDRYLILLINYLRFVVMNKTVNVNTKTKHENLISHILSLTYTNKNRCTIHFFNNRFT